MAQKRAKKVAKATKKKSTKKKSTKKKSKAAVPANSKLDPCLMLGAFNSKIAHKLGIATVSEVASAKKPRPKSKLGLGIRSLTAQMSPTSASEYVSKDLVPVLVECTDTKSTKKRIKNLGGSSKELSTGKLMARVPRTKLKSLASASAVAYIEASSKLKPTCEMAHISSGLVVGNSVTVSETGAGVLIGVIDTGIDVSHPAFKSGGGTRVVNYLDQTNNQEFTQGEIDAGNADGVLDTIGHGTHVAGIAAGNGAGSPGSRWRGVATESDLAIVKSTFDSADIAVAISHIFDLADSRNQPCVVNLSLGGHVGPHDGSTVTERIIDDLSGAGRVVVVSAGNEGNDSIHASTTIEAGQSPADRWVANFRISPRTVNTAGGPLDVGVLRVQVWNHREDRVKVTLRSPTGNLFNAPTGGRDEQDLGSILVESTNQQHPYSLDHSTTFFIVTDADNSLLTGWSIIVEEDQANGGVQIGDVHCWIQDVDMGNFTTNATNSHLVGMPGTSFSAITVASYASRDQWPSQQPNMPGGVFGAGAINLDDISHFSSMGPTRDGHNKPEIAGPGQLLLAPLSSAADEEEVPGFLRTPSRPYCAMQGTSMSAPYVTGAIALLLEKDNNLDWSEIKRRLIKSATQNSFTQSCWNPRWGYGRLQVQRLLEIEPSS